VHDVGEYRIDGESRLLEPGMVFTIEPGLYIPSDDTIGGGEVARHRHPHRGRRAGHRRWPPRADRRTGAQRG
jgi:hypothetical protein